MLVKHTEEDHERHQLGSRGIVEHSNPAAAKRHSRALPLQ